MNFAFFGTPQFASTILERLIAAGFVPSLVVTNPDKPVGRKQAITPPPVKDVALAHNLSVLQPDKLDASLFSDSSFDFFLVVAYGKIIPKAVLDVPRLGTVNVHPSLLPKYRGPTPIQTAILNGDEETGVSLMLLDAEVDHGPVISDFRFKISDSRCTTTSLMERLADEGAKLLINTLPKFVDGKIAPKEQDHAAATFTKKFTVDDARVEYNDLVRSLSGDAPEEVALIDRMIRALNPEPGVWTMTNDAPPLGLPKQKRVKLLASHVTEGALILEQIQAEGKEPRSL